MNHRVGRIDVEVAESPSSRIEFSWTHDYGVKIVARSWLSEIEDLIDPNRIFVGEVRRSGRSLDRWATIHEQYAPPLLSSDGRGKVCPICGDCYMTLWGRLYFPDPRVVGLPLIVNRNGVFVRDDLARERNLRRPSGAFKPTRVRFSRTTPPPVYRDGALPKGGSNGPSLKSIVRLFTKR